ncbi:MAG: hypothetical protein B6241_10650 [Spirochaetaceae bacterium 4572_59]|nr:MAG: hypothetical protein B6241_10650 [Spirochaetaceae bacterium 4572_59]
MKNRDLLNRRFVENGVLIAAHQGFGGGNIVLNTPNAMLNAINCGAEIVELDISRSKDGDFFIFHQDLEPRHLMVNKKMDEMSTDEIKELYLWNNACTPSAFHVPTLTEMMNILKTEEVLVNIDKFDLLGKDLLDELDMYGMEDKILLKGKAQKPLLDTVAAHGRDYMFMPVVFSKEDIEYALSYPDIDIVGFEVIFSDLKQDHIQSDYLMELRAKGYFLWVNAITLGKDFCLSADIDDDLSMLDNPDKGWGRLIDMGFNVIQTDWTLMLKNYLMKKELSSPLENSIV